MPKRSDSTSTLSRSHGVKFNASCAQTSRGRTSSSLPSSDVIPGAYPGFERGTATTDARVPTSPGSVGIEQYQMAQVGGRSRLRHADSVDLDVRDKPGVRPHWLRTGSRSRGVRAVRQLLVSMLPPAEPEPPALLLARGLRPQNRAVQVGTGGRTGRSVQVDLRVRRPQVRHVERLVTVVIVIIDHSSRGYVSGDGWRRRSATSSLSERSAERHRKGSTTIDDRRSTSMPVGLVTCAFALLAVSGSVSNRVHTEEAGRCPMHLSGPRPGHRDLPSWGQPA